MFYSASAPRCPLPATAAAYCRRGSRHLDASGQCCPLPATAIVCHSRGSWHWDARFSRLPASPVPAAHISWSHCHRNASTQLPYTALAATSSFHYLTPVFPHNHPSPSNAKSSVSHERARVH